MKSSILCHFLIGSPGCGKSTLAQQWITRDKNCTWISTDKIRQQLLNDSSQQGNWTLIETEVLRQVKQAIAQGHSVIYDATNVKQSWRISRLQQFADCGNALWMAWVFQTPLEICKIQNKSRHIIQQVPDEVIEEYFQALQEAPPEIAEGFVDINPVQMIDGSFDFWQIDQKIAQILIKNE